MRRLLGPRFGAEAGLIAAAAALAALLQLDWPGIVAAVFGTWLAIAIFEVVWSRTRQPAVQADAVVAPPPPPVASPPPPLVAREPEPVVALPAPPPPVAPVPLVAAPPPPAPPVAPAPAERPRPQVPAGPPRSWNLWELERAARELAGGDLIADEERQYMLLYLRDYAGADGKLPIDFDPLVREVFGEELLVAS